LYFNGRGFSFGGADYIGNKAISLYDTHAIPEQSTVVTCLSDRFKTLNSVIAKPWELI
jgi:hypothetical protein